MTAQARYTYGYTPPGGHLVDLKLVSRLPLFDGLGIGSDWIMTVGGPRGTHDVPLRVFQPTNTLDGRDAPSFLGLNIVGNQNIPYSQGVGVDSWMPVVWPIRSILSRGYSVITADYNTIEPDVAGAAWCGIRGLFEPIDELQSQRPTQWGALGAWAWGLSRAREAVDLIDGLDSTRVIVWGHSRLGMAALWAAAQDEAFAAAVSSQSGLGGASLTRHVTGETIEFASTHFPHWFCGNYPAFAGRDSVFPVDQHQLLACIAPRPVHVGSASFDRHADPEGEYFATLHASPIYELYKLVGTAPPGRTRDGFDLSCEDALSVPMPVTGKRIGGTLSYHVRPGRHGVVEADWAQYLDFADENAI